jgi:membrane associated rhomboid family serine protease
LTTPDLDKLIAQYGLIPAKIDFSDWTTLTPFITSQFLHGGFFHIASNLWFLWIFGDNVEERLGFFFFPIFYLFAGIFGAFLQYIFASDSTIPIIGASGAIAGVLGAYFVLFPNHFIKTLVPIYGFFTIVNIPASLMLFYWFFTQVFNGVATVTTSAFALGGIAWFAHIGGFITGWVIGKQLKS